MRKSPARLLKLAPAQLQPARQLARLLKSCTCASRGLDDYLWSIWRSDSCCQSYLAARPRAHNRAHDRVRRGAAGRARRQFGGADRVRPASHIGAGRGPIRHIGTGRGLLLRAQALGNATSGLAAGAWTCFRSASGALKFIEFCDPDAQSTPHPLQSHLEPLEYEFDCV